jgi:N6-L-threonylcarbamoyladenine synthase
MEPCILAIESSCDETAAAVMVGGALRSNVVASQAVHEAYGGVVPELASRAHQQHIVPVVQEALRQAGIEQRQLQAVAFTQGPGLLGSLLVGASFAKAYAWGLGVPLIGVHHMQAHILAHFIDDPKPSFPFLCLTVSGGHTQLVVVEDYLRMRVVGETQDDAVGEAFDKAAKMLDLPYPGGPLVDRYAQRGNPLAYRFPEPQAPGLDFSFSGIKTAFLYFLRDRLQEDSAFISEERLPDICASMQHALVGMLMRKLEAAAAELGIAQVGIAGGVSANSALRRALQEAGERLGWQVFIPKFEYCTDNAGMIAMAAHYQYLAGEFLPTTAVPQPRMPFA